MNPFVGMSFERLRFEFEVRAQELRDIEKASRREDRDHKRAMRGARTGGETSAFARMFLDAKAKFDRDRTRLRLEMTQIREAMNSGPTKSPNPS